MVAECFFGVGGALRPAHGQPGDSEGRDVAQVVNGIIQQRDRPAKHSAKDFRDDEAERGHHGPGQNGRPHGRMGVVMAVAMSTIPRIAVSMGMARGMRMGVHCYQVYSTSLLLRLHPKVLSCYWKL